MSKNKLPSKTSRADVDAFLKKVASTPSTISAGQVGRLLFAMDATASREPTWDHACHLQGQMFNQSASLGGLLVQLCYYRGYNEFYKTPWISNAKDLQKRMSSVRCLGGHTQIGRVLKLAINETKIKKVNAVVFVGDCMEENSDELCHLAGKLGIHHVPLFLFHEGNDPTAKQAFQQLAKLTQGAYCSFDIGSAQQLRDLLSAVAVYAAGGRRALENFSKLHGKNIKQLTRQINKD